MSDLQNKIEEFEEQAVAALMRHGWSSPAAREFLKAVMGATVLHVADLQRRALSAGEAK